MADAPGFAVPGVVEFKKIRCDGTDGYTKVKAGHTIKVPALAVGDTHTLRAGITGDRLTVWIDDREGWTGALDASVRDLRGPAGMRTDNVHAFVELATPPGGGSGSCQ